MTTRHNKTQSVHELTERYVSIEHTVKVAGEAVDDDVGAGLERERRVTTVVYRLVYKHTTRPTQ